MIFLCKAKGNVNLEVVKTFNLSIGKVSWLGYEMSTENKVELEKVFEKLPNTWEEDLFELYPDLRDTILLAYAYREEPFIVSDLDYGKYFESLEVIQVHHSEASYSNTLRAVESLDLEALVESITNSVNGGIKAGVINTRLEVHQPDMPLFIYNEFKNCNDFCTDQLNREMEEGWRIVAICPQPDQRRPDYILGRKK